jgi:prolyl 4-hydroxylase
MANPNPGQHHRKPFTLEGFKKTKMPKDLHRQLLIWYLQNEKNSKIERFIDKGVVGTIRNINKAYPSTRILHLNQNEQLYNWFNKTMYEEVSRWTNLNNLVHTSTYGIRTYQRGDVLISHTDRPETHIVSAICMIHKEGIDEPWALEIKDPDGWWHEVYFEPGDMVFYESDILEHGRMRPLKGDLYANLYVHFKPSDYGLDQNGNAVRVVEKEKPKLVAIHNTDNIVMKQFKNDPCSLQSFKNVITKKECKELMKSYDDFYQARTMGGTLEHDKEVRKAEQAQYEEETPLLQKVRKIIAEKTNTDILQQEYPIAIIKYEKGGEYKPHHDHWEHDNGSRGHQGNRIKTAILYLNDNYEGGETEFPVWEKKVKGKSGELVVWDNLNKNGTPNMDTLHAGLPVKKGVKYIIVSWIREHNKDSNHQNYIKI